MVQIDLFGEAPEVYIDIHEVTNRRGETSITKFIKLLEVKKIRYQIKKLSVADIVFPNGYAIERKTVKDFCKSLFGTREGRPRLFEQIDALVKTYENPILLIEGGLSIRMDLDAKSIFIPIDMKMVQPRIWSVLEEQIKINPKQYMGAKRYVVESGVRLVETFGVDDGAKILFQLFKESKGEEMEESKTRRYAVVRQKPKLKTLKDMQLFFLSGLPRINIINSKKILEKFGSPYNALLKLDRWSVEIDGIGEKTVQEIKKVLMTPWKDDED
jgi:ERCC4-type nuclease